MKRFDDAVKLGSMAILLMAVGFCHGQEISNAKKATQGKIGTHKLVRYGEMHEVIGMQKHEGRVVLGDLLEKPHFYGVGALAALRGEISVIDSKATVTEVTDARQAKPANRHAATREATMLIGGYVDAWAESVCERDLTDTELDEWIQREITRQGGDVKKPTIFLLRGEFSSVHLHVINGACPVHARIRQLEIAESDRPFDTSLVDVSGNVVGVFALDAAGKLTHPATRTHKHLVYQNSESGEMLTGHVESLAVKRGAKLFLPVQQ